MMEEAKGGAVIVASKTVEALQSYPILLILVVFQLATLGIFGWTVHERNVSLKTEFEHLIEHCWPK